MNPSHPISPPNHRFDDDDDDFDPDRLAHYDALACGIVSVQRARLMPQSSSLLPPPTDELAKNSLDLQRVKCPAIAPPNIEPR